MSDRDQSISATDYFGLRSFSYEEAGIAAGFERRAMLEIHIKRASRELAKSAARPAPDGFLIVGGPESLRNMNLPLAPAAPSLYKKMAAHAL
jgi:hypothetical protein